MSKRMVSMSVVNASSTTINGTAWHASGSGSGRIVSPVLQVSLPSFGTTDDVSKDDIPVRNDHDDYWFWQPTGAAGPRRVREELQSRHRGRVSGGYRHSTGGSNVGQRSGDGGFRGSHVGSFADCAS
jgi:hypothetical protein